MSFQSLLTLILLVPRVKLQVVMVLEELILNIFVFSALAGPLPA